MTTIQLTLEFNDFFACDDCLDGERIYGAGFTGEKVTLTSNRNQRATLEISREMSQHEIDDELWTF